MYSHKLNGPGLKYEIGLNIKTGAIVWINGGRGCGEPDLSLARSKLTSKLLQGEMVVADKGYRDDDIFITPLGYPVSVRDQKKIMARHETVNSRLHAFKVASAPFRHCLSDHKMCVYAVVNIVQLMIMNGHPLYNV